uniref:Myosinlike protein putative n=1 Tax=Albugo laibachii Nc14 TaxID=890382 RepID=F0W3U5_9STRA|nr:myosinlike protein putative [Albugo laibachii Nc14]|eukprot:CCA15693.1 myosinlike protein putative [Albugo laibachii Nc14]
MTDTLKCTSLSVGTEIWIPDPKQVWRIVEIRRVHQNGFLLDVTDALITETIDVQQVGGVFKVNPNVVDDMTSLYYIHEAGILHNLAIRSRSESLHPYTLMANVLIAVNPLIRIVEPKMEDYIKAQLGECSPHPYLIAEMGFQQMILQKENAQPQSIVISGESGAGKTETSKIVLRFLTSREYVTDANREQTVKLPGSKLVKAVGHEKSDSIQSGYGTEIDKRLWDTNPILEAFGNAKTSRNHNSSRFGKFMNLQFDDKKSFKLSGAFIETYLLEKFRVVAQIPGERNFHVFYFLLSGADEGLRHDLRLASAESFAYLNRSNCVSDPNIDDEILFDELVSAMTTVNIDQHLQKEIWKILAAVLHLGNIQLQSAETSEGESAEVADTVSVETCAELLGMDTYNLSRVITEREIATRDEKFTIKRSVKEGGQIRDAIAKMIYSQLFKWIVFRINLTLGHKDRPLPFIGVLDIFGFESFETNEFEQLLINFANEALQATFNQHVFVAEQELFRSEGIQTGNIAWPDNRDCINLIAQKINGILPLLDQESKNPNPSDKKWNSTLHKTHANHSRFVPPHEKDKQYVFIIKHFAMHVTYTIGNFMEKNTDLIPQDLHSLIRSSSSQLVSTLLDSKTVSDTQFNPQEEPVFGLRPPGKSVSASFCDQMQSLVDTLNSTRCSFIRCIKPNSIMTPNNFDPTYVVDQLRCTGMLATCELLQVGLPTRVTYEEICRIYKPALPTSVTPLFAAYTDRTLTEAVLWAFRVDSEAYRLGRTRVFFKTGKIALLDALLTVDMKKMGPWIVSRLRKWLARRRWRYATAKICGLHAFVWLNEYTRRRRQAMVQIQAIIRMVQCRRQFLRLRNAHRNHQLRKAAMKKRLKRAMYAILAGNALTQVWLRARLRIETKRKLQVESVLLIQALVRGHLVRNLAKKRKLQIEREAVFLVSDREISVQEPGMKITAKRRWRVVFCAVKLLIFFLRQHENALMLHQVSEEEKERCISTTQKTNQEHINFQNGRLLALKESFAAQRIQRCFRTYLANAEEKQEIAFNRVQVISKAAYDAAQESSAANTNAGLALKKELNAHQALRDSSAVFQCLGKVGTVGSLGFVEGGYHDLSSFEDELKNIDPNANGAYRSNGVPGFAIQHDTLENADLSWIAGTGIREEGQGFAGKVREEEVAETRHDLYGENGATSIEPLMAAEDEDLNPIERFQEFPSGPPIPYKGGIFTCTLLGHRKQQDQDWGDEYSEYVLRCTWGRDILEQSKTAWLVGGRYNDFNILHQELKAAASGRRGKRAPWFPRFPKRHPFSTMIGINQQEQFIVKREKELNRYMTQVLTQMPDALLNAHLDRFLNLTLRTQDIGEREAFAEARKRWEEEERQALVTAADAEPLNDSELHEVEQLVHQLLQKILHGIGDLRQATDLQEMIHAVKVLLPRVAASGQIGAGVHMELVPLAMQLQDDIQDAFNQYNDSLLAVRLGHDIN